MIQILFIISHEAGPILLSNIIRQSAVLKSLELHANCAVNSRGGSLFHELAQSAPGDDHITY
eukprot:5154759-Ditylum_brightwellii.AAC.1